MGEISWLFGKRQWGLGVGREKLIGLKRRRVSKKVRTVRTWGVDMGM